MTWQVWQLTKMMIAGWTPPGLTAHPTATDKPHTAKAEDDSDDTDEDGEEVPSHPFHDLP